MGKCKSLIYHQYFIGILITISFFGLNALDLHSC